MPWFARILRWLAKLKFRLLHRATIKDIAGARFKGLVAVLARDGWRARAAYTGFDAGIDYDCVRLRRGFTSLKCEWDNWSEWSIEGPRRVIEAIAAENELKVTYAWRWSEYDKTTGREPTPPAGHS
jgi:hypothetical protein